jgi:GntR family transcriptional repressor for pyruvate dehydrogenase complex
VQSKKSVGDPTTQVSLRHQFQQYLAAAGLRPGGRVEPELRLAERFGVSRGKIRELLTGLCHQGVLVRAPRRGTMVRELNPGELGESLSFRFGLAGLDPADAWEARLIIETAVIPLAVRRVTPVQMEKLEQLYARMAGHLDDPQEVDLADRDFHLTLLDACGNRTLAMFAGVISRLFNPDLRTEYWRPDDIRRGLEEHRAILDAIRQDNPALAADLLKSHLSHQRPLSAENKPSLKADE